MVILHCAWERLLISPIIRPLQLPGIKDVTGHSGDCPQPHLNRWDFTKNNSNYHYRWVYPTIFHTIFTEQIPTILFMFWFLSGFQFLMTFLIITKTERQRKEKLTVTFLPFLKDTDDVLPVFVLCTNAPIPTQCSRAFLHSLYFVSCGIENNLHWFWYWLPQLVLQNIR